MSNFVPKMYFLVLFSAILCSCIGQPIHVHSSTVELNALEQELMARLRDPVIQLVIYFLEREKAKIDKVDQKLDKYQTSFNYTMKVLEKHQTSLDNFERLIRQNAMRIEELAQRKHKVDTQVNPNSELCFDTKTEFNKSVSILTNDGSCVRWDDPHHRRGHIPDEYFIADGNSKAAAENFCRHPALDKGDNTDHYYHRTPYLYCLAADPLIEEAMCAIRNCDSTNLDMCGVPPSLLPPALRSYPVVGDVYLTTFKCASFNGSNPTLHCPVSRCIGNNNWTTPSISCSSQDCCITGRHESYAGKRTCTDSGRTCQDWSSKFPHNTHFRFEKNLCRGTKGYKPWCYTTDPEMRWETCGIPEC